jgi:PAS domain S-box-containing protein
MERIAHVPREKITGKNIYKDFSESTIKEFIKYYNKAKKNLQPVFYENIFVFTPGKRKSVQSGWLIPLKEKKEFSHMICTVNDLTKIENIKEKLKDRESRYRAIVSSNSIGVAMVNMEGHPIETNEYLHNMFGYTAEEFKKIHFKEFTHPEDVDIDLNLFQELILGKREYYHIEKRYIHKNGDTVWGDLTATLVRDSEGNPKYVISLVQDITEKKKAETKLKKSRQELKELTNELEKKVKERTKELRESETKYKHAFQRVDFYKNLITHDMNNILQNIRSSIELNSIYLENPAKKDELKEINGILKEQITRAARLIKNARKLSKIKEGKIKLYNTDLCEELKNCIDFIDRSYQSREIDFNVNCEYENLTIKGNELIQDLFENLIMNAIKHNDSTQVKITINALLEKKENQVRVEFIDNGIGISDQKKEHIFLTNSKKTSSSGGMGLGLSLVKKILEIYKGDIWVENRVKGDYTKGSKFIIELPTVA